MENTFGQRLAKYRKAKGLSQEELAFKLNVSRQAVSKWERDEASPDTNNLISLAKIYGVSLDDLIYKNPEDIKSKEEKVEEQVESEHKKSKSRESVYVGPDGIHVKDGEDEVHIDCNGIRVRESGSNDEEYDFYDGVGNDIKKSVYAKINKHFSFYLTLKQIINSYGYLVIAAIYLILGFTIPNNAGWSIYWTLFFIPGIFSSIIHCYLFKTASGFNITFFACFIYLFIGMYMGLWHPTWIVFFLIPLYYGISFNLDKLIHKKVQKKINDSIVVESIE